ncbi:MAG: hypothetical protein JXA90_11025 [Planctomycetes bacterium]|nr:hypothetical protein [Planctomycetota bacterium]
MIRALKRGVSSAGDERRGETRGSQQLAPGAFLLRAGVRRARGVIFLSAAVLAFCGCSHLAKGEPARAREALDPGLLAELRPLHPGRALGLDLQERGRDHERYVFRFQAYSELEGDFEEVVGDYYRSLRAGSRGAPLVAISPILGGTFDDYLACRYFSRQACARGISTFFLHQETVILDPRRDAVDLEARIRENVRQNLLAVDLLGALGEVDADRLGTFGISLGAIKNVALVASDPRWRASVLCLAGADLPAILTGSRERLVLEYLQARERASGITAAGVAREFQRGFRCDPARLAPAVEPARVLLLLGACDDKVPYAQGLLLRDKLGEPETYILPLGHYTSVVAAPWAASVALGWMRERMAEGE